MRFPLHPILPKAASVFGLAGFLLGFPGVAQSSLVDLPSVFQSSSFQREWVGAPDSLFLRDLNLSYEVTNWYVTNIRPLEEIKTPEASRRAIQLIREYVDRQPDAAGLLFKAGELYGSIDDMEGARRVLEDAINRFPNFSQSNRIAGFIGRVYLRESDYPKVLSYLGRSAPTQVEFTETVGLLGFANFRRNDPLAAELAFRRALILQSDADDWSLALTETLRQQRKYRDANAILGEMQQKNPDHPEYWLLKANNFIGVDELDRSAAIFELLDRMGQATASSMGLLGRIYINKQIWDLALRAYSRGLEINPAEVLDDSLNGVELLAAFGAGEEALSLVEKIRQTASARLKPEQDVTLLTLEAQILIASGQGDRAVRPLRAIIEKDPENGRALITLANHYIRLAEQAGRESQEHNLHQREAINLLERARRIEATQVEALIRLGQVMVTRQDFRRAIDFLRESVVLRPDREVSRYLEQIERRQRIREATGQ